MRIFIQFILLFFVISLSGKIYAAGCTNASAFGTATAPTNGTAVTISTCSYQTEYSTINSIVAGNTYTLSNSCGGYITVHSGTYNGTIVAQGNSPLTFTATTSGTYYPSWNTNSSCGTATNCCTTTITCTSCSSGGGGGGTGCTNSSSFGTATAPTTNTTTTISTCNYQTEYSTINSVVAGKTYTLNSSCGGFVTIHSGTYNGPVVASGNAPLTWTAATSGTYYVSWNTNSSCGTATNCCTTTIACTNCSSGGGGSGGCVSLNGNSNCNAADPFCSTSGLNFCNTTNAASLGSGGAYGCLFSTPNPSFFYLNIGTSGSITMTISQTSTAGTGIDVDYVLWGPFSSQNAMCSGYSASNIVACSYSAAAIETATITNAVAGQWYLMLITNYSNTAGAVSFTQTSGSGSTNCNILCNMTGLTATPTTCNSTTNTYSVNGTISFTYPPTSGTLTVSSSCGGSTTIPGPWTSPLNYTLSGITANGAACSITAVFSADPTCTLTQPYTAPASCNSCASTATPTQPTCNGGTGSILVTASSGNAGFNVSWSGTASGNPGGTEINAVGGTYPIPNLSPGTYTVTVTAANGCTSSNSVTITNPPQPPAPTGLACYQTATWNQATCSWVTTGTQPAAPTGLACYQTATWNPTSCTWVTSGTQPAAPTGLACYQTATWNPTSCTWVTTGTQPAAPTGLACYQTATWNPTSCTWVTTGTQPAAPTGLACYQTATWNPTSCTWVTTGTQPAAPTGLACYQTATWNPTSCTWVTTGTQPLAPTVLCYETVTWNPTTCVWDVTGTQPLAPTVLCYETATWNPTTCVWDVTGTQPPAPTVLCYETATWNPTTCVWDVTGTQPLAPTVLCYETATWNPTSCVWDVTGTQPLAPTVLCYETATWNPTTCVWDVTGTQPLAPTVLCYETATWNPTTCVWDVTGTQPLAPTVLCYETATWNPTTCVWDVTGTQPLAPTVLCYETATWNPTTCVWDVTGTQPLAPTVLCYETATWNPTTCVWDVTGTQPPAPTVLCYETATWNPTTCVWDVTGTQPLAPTVLCYETATWNPTTCVWDVTGTQPLAPTVLCYETATWNPTTCVWDVTGTQPLAPTVLCYETATWNPTTCVWDVTGTQPLAPTVLCYETATWNPTTCVWDVTGTQPLAPTVLCYETATWNPTTCVWDVTGTQPPAPTVLCYETATWNPTTCVWDVTGTAPAVSINSTLSTVNINQPTQLTAIGTPAGGTYTWSPSGSLDVATGSVVNASPSTTTTYTVTYDIGNNCTTTATTIITVSNITLSVNSSIICSGSSTTLTATPNVTGGSYLWSPGGQTTQTITVSPTTNAIYTCVYTLNGVSSAPTIGTVTVNPTPTVTVNNPTICAGTSATITAVGNPSGGSYFWAPGGQTTASITVSPAATSTYTVTYTLNNCQGTATSTVTVNPQPTVSVSSATICAGQSTTITATPNPAGGTFMWNNSQTNSSITVSPITSTTYTVMYTLNGCVATGTGTVTVNPIPTVAVSSATICNGESATINATPSAAGGSYSWSPGGATTQSITVNPSSTSSYSVTYTLNGCTSQSASGTVTVNSVPTVSVNSVSICDGDNATLTASPSLPGGTYLWAPSGEQTSSISISPNTTSSYSVVYTLNGCQSAPANGTVNVNPIPAVSFTADQLTGCAPLTVNLSNTAGNPSNCSWNVGNGQLINGCNAEYTFIQGGCYDISLTTTENGCSNTLTLNDYICVENPPVAAFSTNPTEFTEPTQSVSFSNNSVGATSYSWNFGDTQSSTIENPVHTYSNITSGYIITLTASSTLGCVDTYDLTIQYQEQEIFYVPNSFTPDGDNFNQTFKPIFTSGFDPYNFEMIIYNRWGEIVFETKDVNIGWDGSYGTDGRDVQEGAYTYKIIYKNPKVDERKIVVGHVSLIR